MAEGPAGGGHGDGAQHADQRAVQGVLEPHKMFQNSVTLFQKRGGPFGRYDEPVHTKFP